MFLILSMIIFAFYFAKKTEKLHPSAAGPAFLFFCLFIFYENYFCAFEEGTMFLFCIFVKTIFVHLKKELCFYFVYLWKLFLCIWRRIYVIFILWNRQKKEIRRPPILAFSFLSFIFFENYYLCILKKDLFYNYLCIWRRIYVSILYICENYFVHFEEGSMFLILSMIIIIFAFWRRIYVYLCILFCEKRQKRDIRRPPILAFLFLSIFVHLKKDLCLSFAFYENYFYLLHFEEGSMFIFCILWKLFLSFAFWRRIYSIIICCILWKLFLSFAFYFVKKTEKGNPSAAGPGFLFSVFLSFMKTIFAFSRKIYISNFINDYYYFCIFKKDLCYLCILFYEKDRKG